MTMLRRYDFVPADSDKIDRDSPDEVQAIITDQAPEPFDDPTLGVNVATPNAVVPSLHRLVTLGDSLTHGFQSGAILNTHLSYPAIIARELGCFDTFRFPRYDDPQFGGIPINIEFIIRAFERRFKAKLDWWELPFATQELNRFMAGLEDYWERGPGADVSHNPEINHNLAIYGWDLRDTLSRSFNTANVSITPSKPNHTFQITDYANERATRRVLPSNTGKRAGMTPLDAAKALGDEEKDGASGIETLIVMLGANNALGSAARLSATWSKDKDYFDLKAKAHYNIWCPSHFKAELEEIVEKVHTINAQHVIWATVPHVTIIPLIRGVGDNATRLRDGGRASRYFPYYTYCWTSDEEFDPNHDPKLTAKNARAIDSAIDQYNEAIAQAVKAARAAGKDWRIFDLAGLLDRLASRRYIDFPEARPEWWKQYILPPALKNLNPEPDSYFFRTIPNDAPLSGGKRVKGGLFALDGIHPTTIAYGIVAQELIHIMQGAGVPFYESDSVTKRAEPVSVNFEWLIQHDSLIANPPASLDSDLKLIGWLDNTFHIAEGQLHKGNV